MDFLIKSAVGEADLRVYKACFDKNSLVKNLDALKWLHLENPPKDTLIDFAIPKDDPQNIAAIYALFPVRFTLFGKTVLACQSIDTLTDKAYRGKGLFLLLANSVFERAASSGYHFVYGFPNDQSAHGFFSKLGWTRLGTAPFLLRPIKTGYFTKRLLSKYKLPNFLPSLPLARRKTVRLGADERIETIQAFDEGFDALWEEFSKRTPIAVKRDAAYLQWRYIAKPGEDYRCEALYAGESLRGFVVYTTKKKHGGTISYIMEMISLDDASGTKLLMHAQNNILAEGADAILALCFKHSPPYAAYLSTGFFTFPDKLRPIEMNFGGRLLAEVGDAEKTAFGSVDNWFVSYSDSDTV